MIVQRWIAAQRIRLAVLAVAIIVIGIASLHEYRPNAGIIWNIIHGEIWLKGSECAGEIVGGGFTIVPPAPWWATGPDCAIAIPFKWVFMLATLMGVIGFLVSPRSHTD